MRQMGKKPTWRSLIPRPGLVLVSMIGAFVFAAPSTASVQGDGEISIDELVVPQHQWVADCPPDEAFPEGFGPHWCLNVRAYDGDLKLGETQATIDDPLEVTVGIGLNGSTPVIVTGGDSGAAALSEVKVPGGILGMPELDPIIDNEPLGLLSLTATPQLGEVAAEPAGLDPTDLERIALPLSIQLNNLLFGEDCQIGTPADPFVIRLTTGTTEPPEGVDPISGNVGIDQPDTRYYFGGESGTISTHARLGARSVDNTFAVPGVKRCDLLGQDAHDGVEELNDGLEGLLGADLPLDELAGSDAGLFDPVINGMVGLPAGPGQNHMKISVDTALVDWPLVQIVRGEIPIEFIAMPVRFGEVAVGTDSDIETLTIRNVAAEPLEIPANAPVYSEVLLSSSRLSRIAVLARRSPRTSNARYTSASHRPRQETGSRSTREIRRIRSTRDLSPP